jgi:hypothetical protein
LQRKVQRHAAEYQAAIALGLRIRLTKVSEQEQNPTQIEIRREHNAA